MQPDLPPDCSVEFRKRRNRLLFIVFPLAATMLTAFESSKPKSNSTVTTTLPIRPGWAI